MAEASLQVRDLATGYDGTQILWGVSIEVGAGDVHSFASGMLHPLSGLDHMLAAFAVGLWAALSGARRPLVWPITFVVVMALATVLGAGGVPLPFVSYGGTAMVTLGLGLGILMSISKAKRLVQS